MYTLLRHERSGVLTAVTMMSTVFWDVSRVTLVRTDVSEDRIASIIRVKRISVFGTVLAITSDC
jgi:hypothetical protein